MMMGGSLFGNAYTVCNLVHWGLTTINIMVKKSISIVQAGCGGFSNDLSQNCVHKVAWAMWWRVDLFWHFRCDVDDIS